MGRSALMLWMYCIGEDNYLIRLQPHHQGLILCDKGCLLGLVRLCWQRLRLIVDEAQTSHQLGGSSGAVALAMLSENIGANLIGVSSGTLREMRLCGQFLFQRQVALTLAVILQPQKRQTHTRKGKMPFCQHCGADVQYPADGLKQYLASKYSQNIEVYVPRHDLADEWEQGLDGINAKVVHIYPRTGGKWDESSWPYPLRLSV